MAGLTAGYTDDIHARASGKLLLAYAPSADREKLLAGKPPRPLTSRTITDRKDLDSELEKIRIEGLAFDLGEFHDNVYCVSAPIMEDATVVGCYTVSTPCDRWFKQQEHIITAVRRAVAEASNLHPFE